MSTPRTNSSGRPSAYTLYTITGSTWNDCGKARVVSVNPPEYRRSTSRRAYPVLHFINQLLPHFRFRHRFCRGDDQVPLASRGHPSGAGFVRGHSIGQNS